jgi:hypothetical protein
MDPSSLMTDIGRCHYPYDSEINSPIDYTFMLRVIIKKETPMCNLMHISLVEGMNL